MNEFKVYIAILVYSALVIYWISVIFKNFKEKRRKNVLIQTIIVIGIIILLFQIFKNG